MQRDRGTVIYPGSPLLALHMLADAVHSAAFFEAEPSTHAALRSLVAPAYPVGKSAVTATANPMRTQGMREGAVPVVLVDPFGYDPDAPDEMLLEGRLNRRALARVVSWTHELAGSGKPAVVMVWTHRNADQLASDMRALGADAFDDVVVGTLGISNGGTPGRYRLVMLGTGKLGAGLVSELSQSVSDGGWQDSPLLRSWDHAIFVDKV